MTTTQETETKTFTAEDVERAFRAGYGAGYSQGGSDAGTYEFGGGSRSYAGRQEDEDRDFRDFKFEEAQKEK